jgi:hydroxypyruvate reductase
MSEPQRFLRALFDAAVSAAMPHNCMGRWLPERPEGRVIVTGAGKAAAGMAQELQRRWPGDMTGTVIVPQGYGADSGSIRMIEASHPVADAASADAARAVLASVSELGESDTVVCLVSGGGSSLLCLPAAGVSLEEKQRVTSRLLCAGAATHEIQCVRKKLSAIKGGKLARAAAPASVITLIISDVPGNAAQTVASGPTISDDSAPSEALEILCRYAIGISDDARDAIEESRALVLPDSEIRILATSDDALLAAGALANESGKTPYSLGDLSGDARALAEEHAALALSIAAGRGPIDAPCVILSGGKTTVGAEGNDHGGPNSEYAQALALALDGHPLIHAIACDTGGVDGCGGNAGCYVSPQALRRGHNHDLVVTGPTGTSVRDFRAILIARQAD